jgi:hypothetical protein
LSLSSWLLSLVRRRSPRSVENPSPRLSLPRRPDCLQFAQEPAANRDRTLMRCVDDPVQVAGRPVAFSPIVIRLEQRQVFLVLRTVFAKLPKTLDPPRRQNVSEPFIRHGVVEGFRLEGDNIRPPAFGKRKPVALGDFPTRTQPLPNRL